MYRQELIVDIDGVRRQLDMYENQEIDIIMSISDIRKLEDRNASFSKTIKLPGTSNNKKIFEFISELSEGNNFNPNLRSKTFLLSDSIVVFEGNLQLKNVIPDYIKRTSDFEVTIYSEADTLFKSIGERYLTELDLTEYNHNYTNTNIIKSWTSTYENGYYYPLIDYGNSYTVLNISNPTSSVSVTGSSTYSIINNVGVIATQMYPAVYVKNIIDRIFYENYFQYRSDFLESDFFKSLIIPFNNNILRSVENNELLGYSIQDTPVGITGGSASTLYIAGLSSSIYGQTYISIPIKFSDSSDPGFNSYVGGTYSYNITNRNFTFNTTKGGFWDWNSSTGIRKTSNPILKDALNKITVTHIYKNNTNSVISYKPQVDLTIDFSKYYLPLSSNNLVISGVDLQWWRNYDPEYGLSQSNFHLVSGFQLLENWADLSYTTHFSGFSGLIQFQYPTFDPFSYDATRVTYIGDSVYRINFNNWLMVSGDMTSNSIYDPIFNFRTTRPSLTGQLDDKWVDYKSDLDGTIYLQPGEETLVTMIINVYTYPNAGNFIGVNRYIGKLLNTSRNSISSIINKSSVPYGGLVDLGINLPKNVKQKDLLTALFTMFNLYVEPIKGFDRVLKIEPRDDFYNTGKIKDWTDKVDISKDINVQILAETQNRTNLLTYKEDKDYYNTNYKGLVGQVYGQYTHEINNDFINGVNKIESLFSPTPIINIPGCINFPVPIISKELAPGSNVTYNKADTNIRILNRGTTINTNYGNTFSSYSDTTFFGPSYSDATFPITNAIMVVPTVVEPFFFVGQKIRIEGSAQNDGEYTVTGYVHSILDFINIDRSLVTEFNATGTVFTDISEYSLVPLPSDRFIFNKNIFTGYPYAGHFDNPFTPTKDLNFGELGGIYYPFSQDNLTSHTVYNDYWKKFFNELSDNRSKLVTLEMYFTPEDIYNFSFSDIIYLLLGGEGAYYRVNSIEGYNPSGNSPCKVELLKAIDFKIPHSGSRYDIERDHGYINRNSVYVGPVVSTSTTTTTTTLGPGITTTTTTTTSTTTTTTTAAVSATASLTFTFYSGGQFTFQLDTALSDNINISFAAVDGSSNDICTIFAESDQMNSCTILAGAYTGYGYGTTPMSCSVVSWTRSAFIVVNGTIRANGQTKVIGGTTVTIIISGDCETPYAC